MIIRNFSPGDFNPYFGLRTEIERLDRSGRFFSRRSLLDHLNRPNYSAQHDLFIAERGGRLVGFCDLDHEKHLQRALIESMVRPEERGQGTATKLFEHAHRRASELGARVIQVGVSENNIPAKHLLARLGFDLVRRFLEMEIELGRTDFSTRSDLHACRCLRKGEEGRLTDLQNRAFSGSWGFNPNTAEEIAHRVSFNGRSPRDVIISLAGDEPAGYCWTTVSLMENEVLGTKKGRIHMMGVDPNLRARGLGRAVLLAGLAHLKHQGVERAELTVDADNRPALSLYRSTGFEVISTTEWYEHGLSGNEISG